MNEIKPIEAVDHSWSDTGIYEVNGRRIAMLNISDVATEDNQEELEAQMSDDARRLVASWNRLLPFTTEQIEDPGYDLTGTAALAEEMRSFSVQHQKLQSRFNQLEEDLAAERASLLAESQLKQQLEARVNELESQELSWRKAMLSERKKVDNLLSWMEHIQRAALDVSVERTAIHDAAVKAMSEADGDAAITAVEGGQP